FATALHINATNASIALAMLNGGSVVGRLVLGYLADRFDPWALALCTLLFTSVSTFILWGLVTFGVAYGLSAGGWSSLWTGFIHGVGVTRRAQQLISVSDAEDDPIHSTTILGYLMFSRGIGNILSTPISTALFSSNSSVPELADVRLGFDVDNGKYEKMILYVGTCFAGAAVFDWLGRREETEKKLKSEKQIAPSCIATRGARMYC
ncbi:hypothetical protein MPER_03673, partial [Moniliophthora perniciosa FA553]